MGRSSGSFNVLVHPDPFREGQTLAGKYRIERVIGRGGMGVVFAARHIKLEQPVAIKILTKEMLARPEHVERFMREARASIRVRSEHVVRVMDVDVANGTPYLVMELLEGHDLASVSTQRGNLSIEETVDYLLQTCEALAAAHALGIVHRDLKTANLFLTRGLDGKPCIKVLDFGICKLTQGASPSDLESTQTELLGSPSYMSPEQLRNAQDIDARSDIWALGVVAFRLLTRQQPFVGENVFALYDQIFYAPPRPITEFRKDIPKELEAVLLRCLAKRRESRYASVAELARALAPFATREAKKRAPRIAQILEHGATRTLTLVDDLDSMAPRLPAVSAPTDPSISEIRVTRGQTLIDHPPSRAWLGLWGARARDALAKQPWMQRVATLIERPSTLPLPHFSERTKSLRLALTVLYAKLRLAFFELPSTVRVAVLASAAVVLLAAVLWPHAKPAPQAQPLRIVTASPVRSPAAQPVSLSSTAPQPIVELLQPSPAPRVREQVARPRPANAAPALPRRATAERSPPRSAAKQTAKPAKPTRVPSLKPRRRGLDLFDDTR